MGFYINGITCLSGLGVIATSDDFRIILQPVGAIIPAYTNYTFTIECNRSTGLFYQWYKNSVKILNATTPTLTILSATSADDGEYYCLVNNDTKSVRSEIAPLSVIYPLVIITHPVSVITNPLSTVSFNVTYTGSELVKFQWYFNNTILVGASARVLTINSATKDNEGGYYCVLSNLANSVTSNSATLKIRDAVMITTQPSGSEVLINTEFTINCCITGTGPINYYWMKDNVKIASTQSSLGTTDGVNVSGCFKYYKIRNQVADYGNYRFVAYNLVNSVTSNIAPITRKTSPPTIVTDIFDISCEVGDNIEFICLGSGEEPLYYQWYKSDNTAITGLTSNRYAINDVQLTDAKVLYCKVTNIGGSVNSSNATLTVSSQYIINAADEYITFANNVYWKYYDPYRLSIRKLGNNINGESAGDSFGNNVSMNAAGDRVAIGASLNDGRGADSGSVRIYSWDGSAWVKLGDDIDGEAADDHFGTSVSMNAAGDRVAIGATQNDGRGTNSGSVRIYSWNNSNWIKLGDDIDGEAAEDRSGTSVSMNASGDRVAIGSSFNDGRGTNSGSVRIYSWNNSNWVKLGDDIDGEAASDFSGSVSMNAAGDRVAIGASLNDGNGNSSGSVRIYSWNNSNWVKLGDDIDGEAAGDGFGISVSMNAAGDRVAIGATQNNGNGISSGSVRIYFWNGSVWRRLGDDIDGEFAGDNFGYSVSMNGAGDRVAIGSAFNDGNGADSGSVRIYSWNGSVWRKLGDDIDGEAANDWSGYSVSMNAAGDRVAIGANRNDGNGADSGSVRIFEIYSIIQ